METMTVQECLNEGFTDVPLFDVYHDNRHIVSGVTTEDGWLVWYADKRDWWEDVAFLELTDLVQVDN